MNTTTELANIKRIRIVYDKNKDKDGYLSDVRKLDAKNPTVYVTSWIFENKTYFEYYIEWFSESCRPLIKYSEFVFSGEIITLRIDN